MPLPAPPSCPTLAACALIAGLGPVAAQGEGPFAQAAVATFLAVDRDGDAQLDYDEFRDFIARMAGLGQPTSRRIQGFGAQRLAFNRIDTDDDGRASPEELRAADGSYRAETGGP